MNEEFDIDLGILRPLNTGVLLLRLPDVGNASSLVIPDAFQKPSHRGKVIRTGRGRRAEDGSYLPLAVKLDDVVYYQSSDISDGTHVLVQEGDILGIEEPVSNLDRFLAQNDGMGEMALRNYPPPKMKIRKLNA